MANHKLIFTGPVGVGKTTAISMLSDIPTVSTDETASDMTRRKKPRTTVAMDYGLMNVSETERVHLYGTPGQERFDFMWDILTEGGIGLILLLDNSRTNPLQDMHFFLGAFRGFINRTGVAIGVSRMDLHSQPKISDYYQQLQGFAKKPPILEVDARNRRDVSLLIQTLLYSLDPGLANSDG
ncbi:GTP-binding protein [Nitrosococcus oceani]|uniref:GTP-binding protein n=1 Tax=Nitrosococcus oceani TaxID=1229 RepID=UPI0004E94678|nr:ATP/GTP-binding protein [Nitrosococcus oceani]KFI23995.1 GTP-binding protein [Nitrosococcus oceani]